jgi:hypothetical protein
MGEIFWWCYLQTEVKESQGGSFSFVNITNEQVKSKGERTRVTHFL